MTARQPRQLPLTLLHPPEYGRDSFIAAPSNRAALALIERWPDWSSPVAILSGPAGSGKTHLAHLWMACAGARRIAAKDLAPLAGLPPPGSALVIEDIDPLAPTEHALFHLINGAKESGQGLLLTSRAPAAEWRVTLPDLRSRLRSAAPISLEAPEDDLLRQVLVKLFADRQITVDKSVIDFLVVRMERSLSAAVELVGAVDRHALAAGRPITRHLAGEVLAELSEGWKASPDGGSLSS